MISRVEKIVDGKPVAFRMGSRAMVAFERQNDGKSIDVILGETGGRASMDLITMMVRETANDGAGVSENDAFEIVDALGIEGVAALVTELVEAAFPAATSDGGEGTPGKA